ncbi:proprotein convertase P-domain-containing protein [Corallococcus sp. AS-1-12]|uniref:proprotein convertase P-domain-containing protein n=1 Tax=Corallococcus sp. AS-1-12 TaxID=2874598 RepID=UPI001CBF03B7|nr:proprotein convertase P-domain-containing protein [Corallococcus sp. AS-1-12]MBZ4333380.1 proprotein convertase P-domain-containing protein [Corallococcus sp. AS-1-12]
MNSRLRRFLSFSSVPLLLSCGAAAVSDTPAEALAVQAQELATGTPAGIGVVLFLNEYSLSFNVLDTQVPLNSQAAQSIINYRFGPDGIPHTADDKRFVSIEQVDALPYVGPAALTALETYARGTGRVELPVDGWVGTFQGVSFNVAEARRVLAVVNTQPLAALQSTYNVPAAAANAMVAARPFYDILKLGRLPSVDATALQNLKTATQQGEEGDPCTGAGTCGPNLHCEGKPYDGSSAYGRCVTTVSIPGDGASCSRFVPCEEGLACHGLDSGATEGWCRPAWMSGEFTAYADLTLQGNTTPQTATQPVVGLATVPEDITVELDLAHNNPSKLVLTLEDPGGETALLWDGPNEGTPPKRIPVTRGIPRDGSVNGLWKLHIVNPSGVGNGTLREWKLKLTSRWD